MSGVLLVGKTFRIQMRGSRREHRLRIFLPDELPAGYSPKTSVQMRGTQLPIVVEKRTRIEELLPEQHDRNHIGGVRNSYKSARAQHTFNT